MAHSLLTTDEQSVEEVSQWIDRLRKEGKFRALIRNCRTFTDRNFRLLIPRLEEGEHFVCLLYGAEKISYPALHELIQTTGNWPMTPVDYLQTKLSRNPNPQCLQLFNYVLNPQSDDFNLSRLAEWDLILSLPQDPTSYLSGLVQDIHRYVLVPYLIH